MKLIISIFLLNMIIGVNAIAQPKYDSFGGVKYKQAKKTGWFRTERINDRWFFITPEGNPFFSLGATHAGECIKYDELNIFETKYQKNQELLGKFLVEQSKEWGYNSSGYEPLESMETMIPYAATIWTVGPRSHSAGDNSVNADIFDPLVQEEIRKTIQKAVDQHKDKQNCLGYMFIDCPIWGAIPTRGISFVDFMRSLPATAPGKINYIGFLKKYYYNNITKFSQAYEMELTNFDELITIDFTKLSAQKNPAIFTDDEAYLRVLADFYFNFCTTELRKLDSNHLILGDRFMAANPGQAGLKVPETILAVASKYVDVISFQPMGTPVMSLDFLNQVNSLTGKPILLADVNTMTSRPTEGQTDTREYEESSGKHTMEYYINAAECKALIGIHRCTIRDYRPWDTKYYRRGLLKSDDTPYPILVDYTKRTNQMVYEKVYSVVDKK
jgi:hypothetical protein